MQANAITAIKTSRNIMTPMKALNNHINVSSALFPPIPSQKYSPSVEIVVKILPEITSEFTFCMLSTAVTVNMLVASLVVVRVMLVITVALEISLAGALAVLVLAVGITVTAGVVVAARAVTDFFCGMDRPETPVVSLDSISVLVLTNDNIVVAVFVVERAWLVAGVSSEAVAATVVMVVRTCALAVLEMTVVVVGDVATIVMAVVILFVEAVSFEVVVVAVGVLATIVIAVVILFVEAIVILGLVVGIVVMVVVVTVVGLTVSIALEVREADDVPARLALVTFKVTGTVFSILLESVKVVVAVAAVIVFVLVLFFVNITTVGFFVASV